MVQQFNPLAPLQPLANTARQINEQLNVTNKALSDGFASTANQFLAAAQNGGGLPGVPGLAGLGGNPGHGNSNGGGLPSLQNLFPTEALQAVSQVEEIVVPAGVPRLSQALGIRPRRRVVEEPAPETQTVSENRIVRDTPAGPRAGVIERSGY